MTNKQTNMLFVLLIVLTASVATYTTFNGQPEIDSSVRLKQDESVDLAASKSNLIYHTKMIVLESLIITKNSINTALETTIESLQ